MSSFFVITLSDVIGIVFIGLGLLILAILACKDAWVQWRCKHESYYETMACQAICNHCNKNLGFIGTVREQREKDKQNGSKS